MDSHINYDFPRLVSIREVQMPASPTGNVRIDAGKVVTSEDVELKRQRLDQQRDKLRQKLLRNADRK